MGDLMEWLILIVVIILVILFLSNKNTSGFSRTSGELEIKQIRGLKKLSDHLDESLSTSFMEKVEERVRRKNKLKENEYEWRLLDLKRYFILTALLKETPMFSEKVDELWHEMLMFTREYDDFSKKYLGKTLHHSPNVTVESNPDLRGFFDWIYSELFFIRKENIHLYTGFFRHPVHPKILEEFRDLSEQELIERYFNSESNYMETILSLISAMKYSASGVKNYEKPIVREMMKKGKNEQDFNAMIFPFLAVSFFHYDEFSSYMKISNNSASSCTSCGSANSSSCSNNSCSNSSCSSCGGGGD